MGSLYDKQIIREADAMYLGADVDSDENQWRALTGVGKPVEELLPHTRTRMIKIARYLWVTNPLAHRIVEYLVAFTVGGGVAFKANDDRVQKVLTRFWNDPVNAWPSKLTNRARNLSLYGEQFYPVTVNPANGLVRIGYFNPLDILETEVDRHNVEVLKRIKISSDLVAGKADDKWLDVINYNDKTSLYEGEIFAFCINKSPDATRGCSDLLPIIDWLGLHDQFLFNALERSSHLNAWLWDVTLEDATEQQVNNWLNSAQSRIPKPGSIRAHNQKVSWEAISPKTASAEGVADDARLFKLHILGGAGMPDYFFGESDRVTRQGAGELVEPTLKTFQLRQSYIKSMISDIFYFVIDSARTHGMLEGVSDFSFEIFMPRISLRDIQRVGGAMFRIAQSLDIASKHQWIRPEQAKQVFLSLIDQLGIGPEIRREELTNGNQEEDSKTNAQIRT